VIRELLNKFDPRLSTKCDEWQFNDSSGELAAAEELFHDLRDTMCHNRGIGLSAPQVGIMSRAFVLGNPEDPSSVVAFFNPRVVDILGEDVYIEEGCLTYPGMFIRVKRPRAVRVRATDWRGETETFQFEGITARVFLHELDHLDGVTFVKRASPIHLEKARQQMKKLNRQRRRNAS